MARKLSADREPAVVRHVSLIGSLAGLRVDSQHKKNLAEEQLYRLLVTAVVDYAIYMLDPQGIVSTWNPGAQRFKGYSADEIIGQHFSRFYTDEDRATELPRRALETAAREGRFEQEGWRVRRDGTRIWAHVVIDPIRSDTGELLGFAKVTRDVSDRRVAEEQLRRSEERFRLLVQGVRDYAIYMLDPAGRVTNWNAGAERFKGYKEAEVIGSHFSRFYSEEDRASGLPSRALETASREGRFVTEGWRVRKDGSRFWADVVIDAVRDGDGQLIGFAKITRDVTERREAQQALQEANAKLVQAQKMEMIGQLTGGIAHDFNNLLAVVLGNMSLAQKRVEDPRLRQLIENTIHAARRGGALTQRMLAFARRQDLQAQAVDVAQLVRDMAHMLQRSIGPGVQVSTRFPLSLRPVLVDANQLELALLNLAVNARDAMPEGGELVIAAREQEVGAGGSLKPGRYVCLSVEDSGEGMDADTLARAVEPFFTTKGVGKGTGLGLSMIHGFAEQSGGQLLLRSKKGEGTTAELWLPVAAVEPAVAEPPAGPDLAPRGGRPLRVLAVDDDSLVLMNTGAQLEDLGHLVFEATSGEQALRILRRETDIDLVITDQLMPGMTGLQLIDVIRQERPTIAVILATGYGEAGTGELQRVARLGKPFTQADLQRTIAQVMRPDMGQLISFRPPPRS
jgi:PAS domain S-box-containing protein